MIIDGHMIMDGCMKFQNSKSNIQKSKSQKKELSIRNLEFRIQNLYLPNLNFVIFIIFSFLLHSS